jgi:hypothetical protein
MVNPAYNTIMYDSNFEWKTVIKDLKKNPDKMMNIIPSPRQIRIATGLSIRSKSPTKRSVGGQKLTKRKNR